MMKFKHFGFSGFVLLGILLCLSSLSFADIAAPPPSIAIVHLVSNGLNVSGTHQLVFMCTLNSNDQISRNFSLNCTGSTCSNEPQQMGSRCSYFSRGYFSYEYEGENHNSSSIENNVTFSKYYYQLDVQSGRVSLIGADNGPRAPDYPCNVTFLIFGLILLLAVRR